MTTEEKNKILIGKTVEVALFETEADDCDKIIFENVKVRTIKVDKYQDAAEFEDKANWVGLCELATRKPHEWFKRLHPASLASLYNAVKEVNGDFFAYAEAVTKNFIRKMGILNQSKKELEASTPSTSSTSAQKSQS